MLISTPQPQLSKTFAIFVGKLFDHQPYSHHLASSDNFLFLHFKQWLGGQRFKNDEYLKTAVMDNSQYENFYAQGLKKLMQRYEVFKRESRLFGTVCRILKP